MVAHKNNFTWDDAVKISGDQLFNIYGDHSDRNWARLIWRSLEGRGLANFATPEERHRILLRLLTLAVICQEFCYIAWKDGEYPPLVDWADGMGMDPALVTHINGGNFAAQLELEKDDEDLVYEEALKKAVEHLRPELFRQMVDIFCGKMFLFASLWKVGQGGYSDSGLKQGSLMAAGLDKPRGEELFRGEAEFAKTVADVIDEVDPEKMEAFNWVDDGMAAVWW